MQVSCPNCQRSYDVAYNAIGSEAECVCGFSFPIQERVVWSGRPSLWSLIVPGVVFGYFVLTTVSAMVIFSSNSELRDGAGAGEALFAVLLGAIPFLAIVGIWLGYGITRVMTTKYLVTNCKIEKAYGILTRETMEVKIADIRYVKVRSPLVRVLFGLGRIDVATAGTADVEMRLTGLLNEKWLKRQIDSLCNAAK